MLPERAEELARVRSTLENYLKELEGAELSRQPSASECHTAIGHSLRSMEAILNDDKLAQNLPMSWMTGFGNLVGQAHANLQHLTSRKDPNDPGTADNILMQVKDREHFLLGPEELRSRLDEILKPMRETVEVLTRRADDFGGTLAKLVSVSESVEKQILESRDRTREHEKALADLVGEGSIGIHKAIYEDAAKGHARAARYWMIAAVIALLGACGALVVLVATDPLGGKEWGSLHFAIALGVSLLVAAATFCGRSSRAERHNEVLSEQRAAALRTYMAIADTVKDDAQVRTAVVEELTRAIFMPQPTGIARAAEGTPSPSVLALLSKK